MTVELQVPTSLVYVFSIENLPLNVTTDCDYNVTMVAEILLDVK